MSPRRPRPSRRTDAASRTQRQRTDYSAPSTAASSVPAPRSSMKPSRSLRFAALVGPWFLVIAGCTLPPGGVDGAARTAPPAAAPATATAPAPAPLQPPAPFAEVVERA